MGVEMEIILIILTGILMGAFNFGFFLLGMFVEKKRPKEDRVNVDESNMETLKGLAEWIGYGGKR